MNDLRSRCCACTSASTRNHGAASPEGAPGLAALPARLPAAAKKWMLNRLLLDPDISSSVLVEQMRQQVLEGGSLPLDKALQAALEALLASDPQAARDMLLNTADVGCALPFHATALPVPPSITPHMPVFSHSNVRDTVDAKLWKLDKDEGECARRFKECRPESVFAYDDNPDSFCLGLMDPWQLGRRPTRGWSRGTPC